MENNRFNQRNDKNQRYGEWVNIWSNNNIRWHSFFINGIRHGNSKVYDPNGDLDNHRYYAR